eukprot:CAMPEP_0116113526 /NCGR_PEP_ID=MMETSP0327-20121206/19553_1 /TAXON_ID=44447 /ORGANISM="Pseudo-nitzschia delicatissima, Strain B596" /LENGTH=1081 /DNA_ID=CAMNT_0003606885 /DNA_START=180 /DNA_END=3422 /DNA_ORIENTATION=-
MAKVQNSADSAVSAEDERMYKALMISSVGNLPLDVAISLSPTPVEGFSPKSKISKSDGDLPKYSSRYNEKYREEAANTEDYKNARFKIAQYRQQKNARLERENKNKVDGKKQSRRQRRRRSNSTSERGRKKVDDERHQIEVENIDGSEGGELSPRDPHTDPLKRKIKHNTLSSYFSNPEIGTRQARRSCRSIDTSSTTKTKKQSNSSGQKGLSVNELVNSPWANGVKKNSEPFERRVRRTPRNSHLRDKLDNYHPSPPELNRPVRKHFKRRSSNDTSALTQSDSGTRNKPRRKYRNSMSGSIHMIPSTSLPSSPKSSGRKTPKPVKPTINKMDIIEPGLVTPYSVSREPKGKSSAHSYSDRVMIAAESNRTPMANLKKYLNDEKMLTSSEPSSANYVWGETKSLGRTPRKSKKLSRSLLQIPFSDGASTAEISEKRDGETHNHRATLSVQSFGKSVARSMKNRAKNTKRRIGKQLSKMAPPITTKSATSSTSAPVSHIPIDDSNTSEKSLYVEGIKGDGNPMASLKPPSGPLFVEENNEVQKSPTSPSIALKPPSRLCRDENDNGKHNSPISPMAALKPPSGHVPRKESGFQDLDLSMGYHSKRRSSSQKRRSTTMAKSLSESAIDQKYQKQSRRKARSNGNRRSRHKKKSKGKKTIGEPSKLSVETPFVQAAIGTNLGSSWSDPGSSSEFHASDPLLSPSNQIPAFEYIDEVPEDSTIERSFKINPDLHPNGNFTAESYSMIVDEDSTIANSPHYTRKVFTADKSTSASPTTKPETFSLNRPSASEEVHTTYDGNKLSGISTPFTVPPSPRRPQFKGNIDKRDSSDKQNDNQSNNDRIDTKRCAIDEEDQCQQQTPTNEETGEKETNKMAVISDTPLKEQNLSQEEALKKSSKQNADIGPSQPGELFMGNHDENEAIDVKDSESKKENRTKKLSEKQQKELERLRRDHEELMKMDIAFDHDPLAVSEISTTYHPIEERSSLKSRRNSISENDYKSGDPQPGNTSKEKKSKTRRRGSKSKRRKKQDSAKSEPMASPKEQVVEPKDDSAANIVNKSNSQILNLRLLLLQSNPEMQPIAGLAS